MLRVLLTTLAIVLASCACITSPENRSEDNRESAYPDLDWDVVESDSTIHVVVPDGTQIKLRPRDELVFTASASMDSAYPIVLNGVKYTLALAGAREYLRIKYIGTDDPEFLSPEGAAIGDKYMDLQAGGAGPVEEELGWGCYVCLSSGWGAGMSGSISPESCSNIDGSSKVRWFFRKQNTCVRTA